jgi:hypothetical protein
VTLWSIGHSTRSLDEKKSEPHRLHQTAREADGRLIYDMEETGRLL